MATDSIARTLAISALGQGGEPEAYIKSARVDGETLILTDKADTTIEFTPEGQPEAYIKSASVSGNVLTLTDNDDTTTTFTNTDTTYTAGTNITIDANNVISAATDEQFIDVTGKTYSEVRTLLDSGNYNLIAVKSTGANRGVYNFGSYDSSDLTGDITFTRLLGGPNASNEVAQVDYYLDSDDDWTGGSAHNLLRMPTTPSVDGNYVLKCSIVSGVATYSWEAEQSASGNSF